MGSSFASDTLGLSGPTSWLIMPLSMTTSIELTSGMPGESLPESLGVSVVAGGSLVPQLALARTALIPRARKKVVWDMILEVSMLFEGLSLTDP